LATLYKKLAGGEGRQAVWRERERRARQIANNKNKIKTIIAIHQSSTRDTMVLNPLYKDFKIYEKVPPS